MLFFGSMMRRLPHKQTGFEKRGARPFVCKQSCCSMEFTKKTSTRRLCDGCCKLITSRYEVGASRFLGQPAGPFIIGKPASKRSPSAHLHTQCMSAVSGGVGGGGRSPRPCADPMYVALKKGSTLGCFSLPA